MRAVSNLFHDRRGQPQLVSLEPAVVRSFVRRSVVFVLVVVVVVVGAERALHGFMYVCLSCMLLLLLFYYAFTGHEEKVLNFTFNCKAHCWPLLARLVG